ncbi:MAG TPA: prepilin-type N-terminal cleavage/methylation domain-containing protein [Sedimentisphaerales bacterium]|nr:prepilin-type N-terminal cleavage/methylation domain-containing protein [Sedimentisphaerales bacterium]
MKFHSDNNLFYRKGFSLIEAVVALGVLAIITSSVLVIVDQCMNSTADMELRRNAFEIARENMEILLTEKTVSEKSEFGISELYPEIEWQTTIEMFQPQGSNDNWLKAICSSQYYDSKNEIQTVELAAWLTMLSNKDVLKIQKQREILRELEGMDDKASSDGFPKIKPDPALWNEILP